MTAMDSDASGNKTAKGEQVVKSRLKTRGIKDVVRTGSRSRYRRSRHGMEIKDDAT